MKERNVKNIANHIFWLVIYLIPIIVMIGNFIMFSHKNMSEYDGNIYNGDYVINSTYQVLGFPQFSYIAENDRVYNALQFIFVNGSEQFGIKLFNYNDNETTNFLLMYITYIIYMSFIKVIVKAITLLPNIANKLISKWSRGDEEIC